MNHAHEHPGYRDRSAASLRAALEELAALSVDVTTSRMIAMAVGILIERYKIPPEEGFDLVVAASQHTRRSPSDVADLIIGGKSDSQRSLLALGLAAAG